MSATENHSNGHVAPTGPPVMIVDLSKRFGGADVRVLQLATALRAARRPVRGGDALRARRCTGAWRPPGIRAWPSRRRRGDPRIVLDLVRVLRRNGFGVIDAQNPQSQLWSLLAGLVARVPVRVTTVHSQYMAEHGGSARGRFYEGVLRLNRLLGGRFVVVSEPTRAYVASLGVPAARTALIANAVPPAEPDPGGRAAALGDWPPDSLVVGVVARLEPVKGVADLHRGARRWWRPTCRACASWWWATAAAAGRSRRRRPSWGSATGCASPASGTTSGPAVGARRLLPAVALGGPPLRPARGVRPPPAPAGDRGRAAWTSCSTTASPRASCGRPTRPTSPAGCARWPRRPTRPPRWPERAHLLVAERFSVDAMIAATLDT